MRFFCASGPTYFLRIKNEFTFSKKPTLACAFLLGTAAFSGIATADEGFTQKDYESLFNNDPEFTAPTQDARSSSSSMSCFVDTPAFDQFTTGACFSVGFSRTTTAVFRIDNAPSNFSILWSDSRCSSSSLTCFLPISHFQTITLNATVLNNSNGTFKNVSATANYEGFF